MYSIAETTDLNLIRAAISYENSWQEVCYDGSALVKDYIPNYRNEVWLLAFKDTEIAGWGKFDRINTILYIPHIYIYSAYRGKDSYQWVEAANKYMKDNYGAKKILGLSPFPSIKKLADKCNYKLLGTLTKSYQKNGELFDQYIYEKDL